MPLDRLKEALFALVRAGNPGVDYWTTYRAKVVKQDADTGRLDVAPDDGRLPTMSNLRLKLGIPGAVAKIQPGAFVQVGWESGDPTRPYAALFEGGETVIKLSIAASSIVLDGSSVFVGSESGSEPATKGQTLQDFLQQLFGPTGTVTTHFHPASSGTTSPSLQLNAIVIPTVTATKAKVS